MRKIDNRIGSEIGLLGRYANVPAYQIVNNAHRRFSTLSSRLIALRYGPWAEIIATLPQWKEIQARKLHIAVELKTLGGNPIHAVQLLEEMLRLNNSADKIEELLKSDVVP